MPRSAELTARQVAELKPQPSAIRVAANLYLDHPTPTRRSWLFRYISPETGRPKTMGLGPLEFVSVPAAKAKAAELRVALFHGRDPLAERRGKDVPKRRITFGECLTRYIAAHGQSWRSREHARQWDISVRTVAAGLLDLPVTRIGVPEIMAALEPHWQARTATASRVRGRIENVLSYAAAKQWRSGDNPARWRGLLDQMLPSAKRLKPVIHHAAIDWRTLPDFYAELMARGDLPVLALRFLALTAVRRGEVLGATWSEIDRAAGVWTIPRERTKSGRAHRVPLSPAALRLLDELAAVRQSGALLLPGRIARRPVSGTAVLELMRQMRPGMTVHGLRSGFRDWCSNSGVAEAEAEFALAHIEGSETKRAYARDDLLEPRRVVMARWGRFLCGEVAVKAAA
jgi:integrase